MRLVDFKDAYSGRVFLIGNGPSMNRLTDREKDLLKKERTFSGSRWFLWPGHWTTTFYILTERKQAGLWQERGFQNATAEEAKFFVNWQPCPDGWVEVPRPPAQSHDVLNFGTQGLWSCPKITDIGPHLHHGKDTPLAMAQVARYMGFGQMYLLGCETEGAGRSYPDEPRRTHAPGIMDAYYQRAGRELPITDCTPGGRLSREGILKYVPLEEVLNGPG